MSNEMPTPSGAVPHAPVVSRGAAANARPLDVLLPPFAAPGPRPEGAATAPSAESGPPAAPVAVPDWLDALEDAIEQGAQLRGGGEPEPVPVEALLPSGEDDLESLSAPIAGTVPDEGPEEAGIPAWTGWDVDDVAGAEDPEQGGVPGAPEPLGEPARTLQPDAPPSAAPLFDDMAARLERIAETLRGGGIAALAAEGADPLALLVAGFALGSLQRGTGG